MISVINRRQAVAGGAATTITALLARKGLAHASQHDHRAGSLDGLGLPELTIVATDEGYSINETDVPAGRYLVTFTNESSWPEPIFAAFLKVDDVVSAAEVTATLADPDIEIAPDWYYGQPAPGGLSAETGATVRFVVDLEPGVYVVIADVIGSSFEAVELTVTGSLPEELPVIEAAVRVNLVEMAFDIDGEFSVGTQVVEVTNAGTMPHHASLFGVPDGTTADDLFAFMGAIHGGEGVFDESLKLHPANIVEAFDTSTISSGLTMWAETTLEAGTFLLVCFVYDEEAGAPHALLGMHHIFSLE